MRPVPLLWAAFLASTSLGCSSSEGTPPPGPGTGGSTAGSSGSGGALAGSGGSQAGTGGTGGVSGGSGGGGSGGEAGSAGSCTTLLCDPLAEMPMSIKDTGLFPAAPDLSQHPPEMLEYVPDPPLWSDGMEKQRFIILPAGTQIDTTNRQQWVFPEGTIFVKTFFDDSGPAGAPRPIETRLIRLAMDGFYEFFLYQWNEDSTDATLLVDDIAGNVNTETPVNITVNHTSGGQQIVINGGQPFEHTLPSRNSCGACHETNATVRQTFIGFDELRLNSKLTPDAPTTQLQAFADAGLFTQPLPADPATITDDSADGGRLLRIKRFVFGNCVSCHNGQGNVDFSPDVFVANTVNQPTESQSVEPPPGWLRVVPGDPSTSVLYVQMERINIPEPVDGMNRLRPMPPVGLADVAVEPTSLQDVYDWISALPP